jgi:hypothetical protein
MTNSWDMGPLSTTPRLGRRRPVTNNARPAQQRERPCADTRTGTRPGAYEALGPFPSVPLAARWSRGRPTAAAESGPAVTATRRQPSFRAAAAAAATSGAGSTGAGRRLGRRRRKIGIARSERMSR